MIEFNKVRMEVKASFYEHYTVFRAVCDRSLWQHIDAIRDLVTASCGIREDDCTALYIITKDTRRAVRDTLEAAGIDFRTISEVKSLPLKLVVNAVCRDADYISVGGRNFYLNAAQFRNEKGKLKEYVDVPEIWASREGCITVHNVRFKKYWEKDKGPYYKYENGCLTKTDRPNASNCYVIHGKRGTHAPAITYFAISEAGYIGSRSSIIRSIVCRINSIFDGDIHLVFEQAEDTAHFEKERIKKCETLVDEMIERQFADCGVKSDMPQVYDLYDIPRGEKYRIELIDSKESFKDGEDPYRPDFHVQHITKETYQKISSDKAKPNDVKAIVRACLVELAIKKDIESGKDSFNINRDEVICIEHDPKESLYWYCRKTYDDSLAFGMFTPSDELPEGIPREVLAIEDRHMMVRDGQLIGLKETEYAPLPSEETLEEIVKTKGQIRSASYRNRLIGGMLDIHIFSYEGRRFYYSASIGNGMRTTIPKASTMIEIIPYTDPEMDSYEWLFEYLGVTYINAGNRFTKYPYLFKYLREYRNVCIWEDASGDN